MKKIEKVVPIKELLADFLKKYPHDDSPSIISPVHRKTKYAQAWRTIGGKKKYFRSKWEANYARVLEYRKQRGEIAEWYHEPYTFWFEDIRRGTRSYLPDFKVVEPGGCHYWVEVKGYMDPKSRTKLKRFAKYYPKEKIVLIDSKWFKQEAKHYKNIIKEWEV